MSAVKSKRRKRTPSDACEVPAAPNYAPALTAEQLRVLHQVYGIILAHSKPAGAA